MENAEIFLNGKLMTKTDKKGEFVLEQVSSGKYKIDVKKEKVEFRTLEVEVSPKNHKISSIIVSK